MFKSNPLAVAAVVAASAASLGLAACGSSSAPAASASLTGAATVTGAHYASASTGGATATPAKASAAALKLAKSAVSVNGKTVHKQILVSSRGRAIYLLTGDSKSHPKCASSTCLSSWPAATTSSAKPKLGAGVHGKLTVWKHHGMRQLVLNGHPLYTYAGDSGADVASGNGVSSFGGTWWALNSRGGAVKASSSTVTSTSTTGSGSGW